MPFMLVPEDSKLIGIYNEKIVKFFIQGETSQMSHLT